MSTSHFDTVEERGALLPTTPTPSVPDIGTVQHGVGGGGPSLPPRRTPRTPGRRWLVGVSIAVLVALIVGLSALVVWQLATQPTGNVAPISTATTVPPATTAPSPTALPSPTPSTVVLGPQSCPAGVADATHWQPIINTYESGDVATVGRVECASMLGVPSLQTLVTAQHADKTLDAFVFTNITSAAPGPIFQLKGLLKGDAKISAYSTVMTAEVDQHSSINAGKPLTAMTPDLFREFAWSSATSTMQQIVFPGIFPDLTRYQAEADQVAVNQGHHPWKLSATSVASAMVTSVLGWPATTSVSATLLSGGGSKDTQASVAVSGTLLGPTTTLTATLARLGDRTQNGIWEVISVTTEGLAFTSPAPLSQLASPVTVTGTGNAFEGDAGHIWLLDHLYTSIGEAKAVGAQGMGPTTFTATLSFTSTFAGGAQEGVLMLQEHGGIGGPVIPTTLEKVLIGGAG